LAVSNAKRLPSLMPATSRDESEEKLIIVGTELKPSKLAT
jgi:hypothetical protein